MGFDQSTRELLDGKNFATLATVNPDGGPQSSVLWLYREGDTVLFSVTAGRQKARNIARDPRVSVTVFDLADPYHSVEIRGRAELVADPEKQLSKTLSHKYLGEDPPAEPVDLQRLAVRVVRPRRNCSSARSASGPYVCPARWPPARSSRRDVTGPDPPGAGDASEASHAGRQPRRGEAGPGRPCTRFGHSPVRRPRCRPGGDVQPLSAHHARRGVDRPGVAAGD
jgi:PPOX class probable F420-dependent enzyme